MAGNRAGKKAHRGNENPPSPAMKTKGQDGGIDGLQLHENVGSAIASLLQHENVRSAIASLQLHENVGSAIASLLQHENVGSAIASLLQHENVGSAIASLQLHENVGSAIASLQQHDADIMKSIVAAVTEAVLSQLTGNSDFVTNIMEAISKCGPILNRVNQAVYESVSIDIAETTTQTTDAAREIGILYNYISDHFPVFNFYSMERSKREKYMTVYPRHTGGAVLLRFLVKTAITVVTPPVVFHSFPLPVTHVFFFAAWRPGGTTAV